MKTSKANIDGLTPYVAGKSSEEIGRKYGLENVTKLGSNENPLGTSPFALQAMKGALGEMSVYPDGSSKELINELSHFHKLPESYFIAGNGSDEILLMICAAFLSPGDEVLISENTFSQYECCSVIFDARIKKIPLDNFTSHLDKFAETAGDNTRICFLCNPNNPTGTYFTRDALSDLLEKLPETCLVVLDEAYGDYADDSEFPDFREMVKQSSRLIVCKTFSKLFGLAGVRLGFGAGSPELIEVINKVKNFNPFNVNRVAQAGGVAALKDGEFINKSLETVLKGRDVIRGELESRGYTVLPSQANYICFQNKNPNINLALEMEKRGVIIRDLKSFAMPGWCRVTVGTEKQIQTFLEVLDKVSS